MILKVKTEPNKLVCSANSYGTPLAGMRDTTDNPGGPNWRPIRSHRKCEFGQAEEAGCAAGQNATNDELAHTLLDRPLDGGPLGRMKQIERRWDGLDGRN
jgi:hypothetical protein